MGTVKNLYNRLKKVDLDQIVFNSIDETKLYYTEMNLEQMMNGKRRDGQDITPSYLDDPYFKTYSQALQYSDWKDRIEPYTTKRNPGTPNLFINGYYHSTLTALVSKDGITILSGWSESRDIEAKYTRLIYGLWGEWRGYYFNDGYAGLRVAWRKRVETATGLKLK